MASGRPKRGRMTARTLFLSDIHLGFRHARVRELNEFLHGIEAECIVLVCDIIDALSLARSHHLSVYDAAYLELSLRRRLPLATLDTHLRKAAKAAGIVLMAS